MEKQTATTYTITQEERIHPFGMMDSGSELNANWNINGNILIAKGRQLGGQQIITEAYKYRLISLTTNERVYTKFKFIQ